MTLSHAASLCTLQAMAAACVLAGSCVPVLAPEQPNPTAAAGAGAASADCVAFAINFAAKFPHHGRTQVASTSTTGSNNRNIKASTLYPKLLESDSNAPPYEFLLWGNAKNPTGGHPQMICSMRSPLVVDGGALLSDSNSFG